MTVEKFPKKEIDLCRTASNIAQDGIDEAIILTIDDEDLVTAYCTSRDDELNDKILVAALGANALDKVLMYGDVDILAELLDVEDE